MNIYIKKVKNTNEKIIETLWVNYTINGKRFRKPLDIENTKANYKRAENEILPLLQYKLMNGELNQNKKIPTVDEYMKFSFELHSGGRGKTTIYGHQKNYDKYIKEVFGHKSLDKIKSSEIRLFGKPSTRKHRRMGVALARGKNVNEARKKAQQAAARIKIGYK